MSARAAAAGLTGVFHWAADLALTKAQQTEAVGAALGLDVARVRAGLRPQEEAPTSGAARPRDCRLGVARLEGLGVDAALGEEEAAQWDAGELGVPRAGPRGSDWAAALRLVFAGLA
jgi:hypothetical protein